MVFLGDPRAAVAVEFLDHVVVVHFEGAAWRPARSMRSALEDLSLDQLFVVHPGADVFPLAENVQAVGANVLLDVLATLEPNRSS
ncbi:MAG: hypothetical protein GY937_10225 [bacterium]|nr:hypothetical protein [bacterium]